MTTWLVLGCGLNTFGLTGDDGGQTGEGTDALGTTGSTSSAPTTGETEPETPASTSGSTSATTTVAPGESSTGGSTTAGVLPGATVLSLSFAPIKQFDFTWDPVADATSLQLFERPDADALFSQVGADLAGDELATSLTVPLHFRSHAGYFLRACNANGCTDSNTVDVTDSLAGAVGYFKPLVPGIGDNFGRRVAISADGMTIAVGATNEDDGKGAVHVFIRSGDDWSEQAVLQPMNAEADDMFGYSLALSANGDTLASHSRGEDSGAKVIDSDGLDNSALSSGAVYVFTRGGNTWSQQAYIKPSNTDANDSFGYAIDLDDDGDTLAVGSRFESSGVVDDETNNGASMAGAVFVFVRDGSAWSQQAYLKAADVQAGDIFGFSVALSDDGDTLAVGSPYEGSSTIADPFDTDAAKAGAVYVFTRSDDAWTQQAYVKAAHIEANDHFGYSVALSGDATTLAVGIEGEDSSSNDPSDNGAAGAGAVAVFTRADEVWSQQAYLKALNKGNNDYFGEDLAIDDDGDVLVICANGDDGSAVGVNGVQDDVGMNSGAVYVFTRTADQWSQEAYVKASNTDNNDSFCFPAISGDGDTMAIGAPGEQSSGKGVGGEQGANDLMGAGAVYVY